MKRTKLSDRVLPPYSRAEEIMNMVTHIVGGGLGVAACALCVVFAALHHDAYAVVGSAIFGGTMILLYTMSSIYHGLSPEKLAKKVFQVIDHCSIFLLIAGTYTPLTLVTLREKNTALGWTIFGIVWGAAALGIALNGIDLKKFSKFSMICYLAMGWVIVITAKYLPELLGTGGLVFLITGGVAYTFGAVLYIIGKKKKVPFIHSVFHIFVVIGSILHFFLILFYVI